MSIGGDQCLLYAVHISGLPWIWTSGNLPSAWGSSTLSYDSETYRASPTLLLPEQVEVEEIAEPWAGIAESTDLQVGILMSGMASGRDATPVGSSLSSSGDPILSAVCGSPFRGATGVHVTTDMTTTSTTLQLDDGTDFGSSGEAYIGLETVRYTGVSSDQLTGLTRGLYGSHAKAHRASHDSVEQTGDGGAYISDHPLVLSGRILSLFVCPGRLVDGRFVPDGASLDASDNFLAWRGVITGYQFEGDLLSVTLTARSLTTLLEKEVGHFMPRHTGGYAQPNVLYVGPDNWMVRAHWFFLTTSGTTVGTDLDVVVADRLQNSGGFLAEGFYNAGDVFHAIEYTIAQQTAGGAFADWTCFVRWSRDDDEPSRMTAKLHLGLLDATWNVEGAFRVVASGDTIWRELGWTDDVTAQQENPSGNNYQIVVEANRTRPRIHLPRESAGRWIPYQPGPGTAFDATTGLTTDGGASIPAFVRIEDEILRVNAFSSTTVNDQTVYYVDVDARGYFGSERYEHYVEAFDATEEDLAIVQVVGLPSVSWPRALLYCLLSGSGSDAGYDRLWWGLGPHVDSALVDQSGIVDVATQVPQTLRSHCIVEPITIAELFRGDLVASQCSVHVSSGRLTCTPYRQVDEVAGLDASSLDHDSIATRHGVGLELAESRIVNEIIASNAGYDAATGQARATITHRNGTSTQTWGTASPVEIDMRGFPGEESARSALVDMAQRMYALFARPFPIVRLPITRASLAWLTNLHDTVAVTHGAIPDAVSATWGVTDALGVVLAKSMRLRDSSSDAVRGFLTVALLAWRGWRHSRLCPCAYGTAISTTTITTTRQHFGNSGDGSDSSFFEAGHKVRVYQVGDESTAIDCSVVSTTSTSIVVDSSVAALTPPVIVEFSAYDTVDLPDAQLAHAYMSDDDHSLQTDGAAVRAFQYS